jgi:hypothetical protein
VAARAAPLGQRFTLMTRKHRLAHRFVWPLLALAVGFAFLSALVLRAPPSAEVSPATEMRK